MRRSLPIIAAWIFMSWAAGIGLALGSSATTVTRAIFVNPSAAGAGDSNPGTADRPVATLTQALVLAGEYNARAVAVRVMVSPGIYREALRLSADDNTTSAPITLEGTDEGVVVSGSDVWTNWTDEGSGILTHPWSERWGLGPLPDGWDDLVGGYLDGVPVIRRQEMVFVDGLSLTQVMSNEEVDATENGFFVDEDQGRILIHVPEPTDVSNARIEVAMRPYLLQVSSRQNITIDNMSFQHAATPLPGAAVSIADSSNVVVSGSDFIWNSWTGLGLYQDEGVTVRQVEASHNGVSGLTGSRISDLLVSDTETSYNNWRGSRGWNIADHGLPIDANFIDFATGQKFFSLRDATFRNVEAIGNLTGGIWLDYDNENVTLENVVLQGNLTHGLMVEASQGPVTVVGSEICGNETGILTNNSSNVRVVDSVLAGNLLGQLFLGGIEETRTVTEFDTGQQLELRSMDWVLRGNEIAAGVGQLANGTYLAGAGWSTYVDSLDSEENRYLSSSGSEIFRLPGGTVDFRQWKAATGTDLTSTFSIGESQCPLSSYQPAQASTAPSTSGSPSRPDQPVAAGPPSGHFPLRWAIILGSVALIALSGVVFKIRSARH